MLSRENSIERLNQKISAIPDLKQKISFSPEFRKWLRDTEILIQKIFGEETRHITDFTNIRFGLQIATTSTTESEWQQAYRDGLDSAEAILISFIDEVDNYWEDYSLEINKTDKDNLYIIEKICNRFHLVVKQLRFRHDNRDTLEVKDEYDVQDLFHSILILEFDDIRREEGTPSDSGCSSRIDFLLKQEKIAIEIKKARPRLKDKELGEQLMIDISRYRSHPDCHTLICFVYDPEGQIANPRGLENDLSGDKEGLKTKVIIAPK